MLIHGIIAYRLWQVGINVGILQSEGHTGPKAPPSVEDVNAPKLSYRRSLLFRVCKERRIRLTTM